MIRSALSAALAIALGASCTGGASAYAQPIPDTAYRSDGTRVETRPTATWGRDGSTGQPCLLGATATCLLPSSTTALDHAAILAGNAFSAGTSVQTVPANNFLNARLLNTSATANCTVVLRRSSNLSTSTLTYWSGNSPAPLTGATTAASGNRFVGGSTDVTSAAVFTWNTATTAAIPAGGPSDGIQPNGGHDDVTIEKVLAPGASLGITIGAPSGALAAAAQVGISMGWYGC